MKSNSLMFKTFSLFGFLFLIFVIYNSFNFITIVDIENPTVKTKLLISTIVATVSITIGCIVFVLLVHKSVFAPIKELNDLTKQITKGDLTKRMQHNRKDEMGILINSFNHMNDQLKLIINDSIQTTEKVLNQVDHLSYSSTENKKAVESIAQTAQRNSEYSFKQKALVEKDLNDLILLGEEFLDVNNTSKTLSNLANNTLYSANKGKSSLDLMSNQMNLIIRSVREISDSILSLSNKTDEIKKIVDIINNISSQTNLLALNASIEAAKAGTHGAGFAVVANEVKKLAEESSNSAFQIAEIINQTQNVIQKSKNITEIGLTEVNKGIEYINHTESEFKEIVLHANNSSVEIESILHKISNTTLNLQELIDNIKQIEKLSAEFSSNSETIASTTEQQHAFSEEFLQLLLKLSQSTNELNTKLHAFKI